MTRALLFVVLLALGCEAPRAPTPPPASSQAPQARPPTAEEVIERAFHHPSPLFEKKRPPRPGDWLDRFDEPGQSFLRYRHDGPTTKTKERTTIVLQPLGELDGPKRARLDKLRRFASVFFQTPVELASPIPLPAKGQRTRHDGSERWVQHHTRVILELLETRLPAHAVCLLGVTFEDLYPEPSWNFVFGEATLEKRVGVYSFSRFLPRASNALVLQRSYQLLAHETGHMFSMHHCTEYECLMNGSNSLEESDRQAKVLCPVCLRKLHHALGFDIVRRYEGLAALYRQDGLDEHASWMDQRVKELNRPAGQ